MAKTKKSKPLSPCKGCNDRHVKCHSSCELYLQYRNDLDEYNDEQANEFVNDYVPAYRYGKRPYECNTGQKDKRK